MNELYFILIYNLYNFFIENNDNGQKGERK